MGDNILIFPPEISAGQYQVWYTPKYQALVNPTDILRPYMDHSGWIEYAITATCVKVMNKLNLDPSGFMTEAKEYKDLVISSAYNRNNASPKHMANTYDNRYTIYGGGSNWGE
jgi:hypothetical protein